MKPCNCESFQSCQNCNPSKIIAGIDPGVKTGVVIWDCNKKKFVQIFTASIIESMDLLLHIHRTKNNINLIRFEDARLRTWFGNSGREKLQGAGSIKRDSSIWQEFCEYHSIKFEAVKPSAGNTKWNAQYFKKVTGWTERTSQHSRDAALLVYGY